MAKKVGKHARVVASIAPVSFLMPSMAVGACIAGVVSNYEPLAFDASQFPAPRQTQTALLASIDTSEVERATAEPSTGVEYSAADYGIDATNLKDGTYTGSGQGFKSTITVQVVISGGKIASISVLSEADDTEYFARARGVMTSVLSRQSTSVDTVSGATYSSKGILMAIRNALAQAAGGEAESVSTTAPSQVTKPDVSLNPIVSLGSDYADGTFVGTGLGFNGDVVIAATMQDGKLVSLAVVQTDDDEEYFSRAESLLSAVMLKQSTSVDTVSGATYSSKGILAAIEDALAKSKAAKTEESAGGEESPSTPGGSTQAPGTEPENPSAPDASGGSGADAEKPNYLDGEYTAAVKCENEKNPSAFEPYYLMLTVVVKDGEVSEIKDIHGSAEGLEGDSPLGVYDDENDEYIDRSVNGYTRRGVFYRGVLAQLLEDNVSAAKVTVVSSATYSSKAFAMAYEKALAASAAAYEKAHSTKADLDSGQGSNSSGVTGDADQGSSKDSSGEGSVLQGSLDGEESESVAARGASHV